MREKLYNFSDENFISKDVAIAILQKIKPIPCRGDSRSTTHLLQMIAIDMAIEALGQEPKLAWTPASNPPKEDGEYLVSTTYDTTKILSYANNLQQVDEYDFWNVKGAGWYDYDSEYGYGLYDEVIAWCELPEPYKESESENENDN